MTTWIVLGELTNIPNNTNIDKPGINYETVCAIDIHVI